MRIYRSLAAMLVCLLLFSLCNATVLAEGKNLPDSFLIDDENGISVDYDGEYYMFVDDLNKGDVITRTLTVRNLELSGSYSLFLEAEPLMSVGSVDWLDNLHLKISRNGDTLYEGRLRGDGEPTQTMPGGELEMINIPLELGSFASGEQDNINIVITVDAEHLDWWILGEKSVAEIRWTFSAEADESGDTPFPPTTGDLIRAGVFVFILLMLIAALIVFVRYRKLRGND